MLSILTVLISADDRPFGSCSYMPQYVVPMVFSQTLAKDQVFCYIGSFMFGSNGTIKTKVAHAKEDGSFDISDEQDGTLAVLNTITFDSKRNQQLVSVYYTQLRCASDSGCKVQYFALPNPSYVDMSVDAGIASASVTQGTKVVVSTKKTGSLTSTVKYYLKAGRNTKQTSYSTYLVVAGLNNKDFKIEGDDEVAYQAPTGPSTYLQLYATISTAALASQGASTTIDLTGSVTATWDNAKSASADEEEFYIPEIEATLSTKGGVFTKDSIDQSYPGDEDDGGLSAGAIAGIVIACIAAVIIIAVCVWLFACGGIKKCKKGKVEGEKSEDAPKESSQNQKEAAPADAASP